MSAIPLPRLTIMATQSKFPFPPSFISTNLSYSAGYPVRNHHSADGCRERKDGGQTYARRHRSNPANYNGMDAIMYSWYFPRLTGIDHDHTHDWQTVVVWFNGTGDDPKNYNIYSYSRSTRDGYRSATPDQLYQEQQQIVHYTPHGIAFYFPRNREEAKSNPTFSKLSPPLYAWDSLSPSQVSAFNDRKNFGGYSAPFSGDDSSFSTFSSHLGAAWDSAAKSGPLLSSDV